MLLPPIVIPVPAAALRFPPVLVLSVTVRLPPPASTSARSINERSTLLGTSSVTEMSAGNVPAFVGSSLTGVMSTLTVPRLIGPPPPAPVLPLSVTSTWIVSALSPLVSTVPCR